MWLIFISFFKNILNFFSTKIGQIVLVIILIIGLFYYTYNKGYNNGANNEKAIIQKEHNEALAKLLSEAEIKKQEAVKQALATTKKEKEIVIKWKEKIVEVEKIINNDNMKNCKMPENDFKQFNEILDNIKWKF